MTMEQLREMGFCDPWHTNTATKKIPTKYGIFNLNVWVENNIAKYAYFGIPKEIPWETPYIILNEQPEKFHLKLIVQSNGIHVRAYPSLFSKEDLENICLTLTGKSIYDIDIKEDPKEKEEGMKIWKELKNFGEKEKEQEKVATGLFNVLRNFTQKKAKA